jgi:PAS domain S-box-containing protein
MNHSSGRNQAGAAQEHRLAAGLLFTMVYALTVVNLRTELASNPFALLVLLATGGGALARMFSWKPALVVSLVLFATTFGYNPWKGARSGRPEDLLRLVIYVGVALGLLTAMRLMQKVLERTLERYRLVVESASDGVLITDRGGNGMWANPSAREIFGYTLTEMLDLHLTQLFAREDLGPLPLAAARAPGRGVLRECRVRRKDGAQRMLEVSDRMLMDGTFMVFVRDVTLRRLAEEEIKESLKEKEVLLREIHHRVKNNLQIVSSLIRLQASRLEDSCARAQCAETLERINSITLLHEKLYLSKNLAKVDFGEYVPNLVSSLQTAYLVDGRKVKMEIEIRDVTLGLETAVPCGLIITELVSNALKYAFPGDRQGCIRIEMWRPAGQTISLRIADTGVGLPETPESGRPQSLGLTLVSTLVRQLKGTLEIGSDAGSQFTITFSVQEPVRLHSVKGDALPITGCARLNEKEYEHVLSPHSCGRG